MHGSSQAPFGRYAAAMITPFAEDGRLDLDGAQRLATHLVDRGHCDALVVGGTTGESATTSDQEKSAVIRAVSQAVGDRAVIVAGVSSADTRHAVGLAREAEAVGADGLLAVTPYFTRPGQEGIRHHLLTVADATGLPVLLYDIPARTGAGTALSTDTLLRLAEHPRVKGVKDCAYDLMKSGRVLAATELAYYSGCDEMNLPLRAIGGSGYVSTVANVAGPQVRAVLDAFDTGDHEKAARYHQTLLPLIDTLMNEGPGTTAVKALFRAAGLPGGPVRAPLLPASQELTTRLASALRAAVPAAGEH